MIKLTVASITIAAYVVVLLFSVGQAFMPAPKTRSKRIDYDPADQREFERTLNSAQATLRLTLYNELPTRLKGRLLDALARGVAVQIVSALVDENFLHKARSEGANIHLSVAGQSRSLILIAIIDDNVGFTVASNVVARARDGHAVGQLVEEFKTRFAQWTPMTTILSRALKRSAWTLGPRNFKVIQR